MRRTAAAAAAVMMAMTACGGGNSGDDVEPVTTGFGELESAAFGYCADGLGRSAVVDAARADGWSAGAAERIDRIANQMRDGLMCTDRD